VTRAVIVSVIVRYHPAAFTLSIANIQGPNPRPDKFACRNCKQSGHSSKECTEPRSAEGVECKKCNESLRQPLPIT
jgi:predicted SprT family Zn-dependent metalloprotease